MASGLALALYALLLVPVAILVWRRPVVALYAWLVGLAAHNAVMAALYGAGVGGGALTALPAWKELLPGTPLALAGLEGGPARDRGRARGPGCGARTAARLSDPARRRAGNRVPPDGVPVRRAP